MPRVVIFPSTESIFDRGYWLLPADFPTGGTLTVECIGGGTPLAGGAYSKTTLTGLNPQTKYYISIADDTGGGQLTWFNKTANTSPATVADGCVAIGANGSNGGLASGCVGDVKFNGGNKGANFGLNSGGAGGTAGPSGAGANGGDATVTTGGGGGAANGGSVGNVNGTGGSNRFGAAGGSVPNGTGLNGAGGGGGNVTTVKGGDSTDDIFYTDYSGATYGPSGGGGGYYNTVDTTGTTPYRGGFVVLSYNTGSATTTSTSYTEIFSPGLSSDASGYWRVPYGVTSITVEAVGGGGYGGNAIGQYGGGGGAYAKSVINVFANKKAFLNVPTYDYGSGSNPRGSSSTYFNSIDVISPTDENTGVKADNGARASTSATNGGQASTSVGQTKFSGGNGGANSTIANMRGGGGGGSAGPTAAGNNGGAAFQLASGTTGAGGGGGGAGLTGATAGNAATAISPTTLAASARGGQGSGGTGSGGGSFSTTVAAAGTNGGGGGGGQSSATAARRDGANSGQFNITGWTFQSVNYGIAGGGGGSGRNSLANDGTGGSPINTATGLYSVGGGGGSGTPIVGNGGAGLLVITYTVTTNAQDGSFLLMF